MSDLPPIVTSSHQPVAVDRFIAAFGEFGLIGEEIADVIWLALEIQQYEPLSLPSEDPLEDAESEKADKSSLNPIDPRKPIDPSTPSESSATPSLSAAPQQAEIHASEEQPGGEFASGSRDLAIRLPDARSVQEPLTLARSLRPLFRRVPSVNMVLDEAATIERIAEEQLWTPVLKPDLEPWLELALVVDESKSMLLWQRTIRELQRLLERYGIFRDVRTWGMVIEPVVDKDGKTTQQIRIRPGIGKANRNQRDRSPGELLDPQGRRLVLIATDCVAPHWHDGTVLSALRTWSQSGSIAIIQMLPEWLWSRTALGLAAPVRFRALLPGLPSQQLKAKPLSNWDEIDFENGIPVPIVTLEPEIFTVWSQLVAGKGGVWAPGFVFEPELFEPDGEEEDSSNYALSAEQRVRQFYNSASPMAWKLACLLAAAPIINLPVVRIIQHKKLPKSRQVHTAEVFLGGLLSPSQPLSEITPDTNPDTIRYVFVEGVREALLESSLRSESINVFEVVSQYITGKRTTQEFIAYLKDPEQLKDGEFQSHPIAQISAQILKQLGGEYARYAEQLERVDEPSADEEGESPIGATIEPDPTAKLLEPTWICNASFLGHEDNVTSVCFSPNAQLIASSSDDHTIRLWTSQGDQILQLSGHLDFVHQVAFNPDGLTIASASADKIIKLWNLQGEELHTLLGHTASVLGVAFSPDGQAIASASADKTIRLWDRFLGNPIGQPFEGHTDSIWSVAFSPDGQTIASASADKTIRLWDRFLSNPIGQPFEGHTGSVWSVAFSPDGQTIASASADNTIKLWNLQGEELHTLLGHTDTIYSVAFSPDGQSIVSGSRDRTIRIWSQDGTPVSEPLQGHEGGINSVAFSPDAQMLVSCSGDKSIKLWKMQEAKKDNNELKSLNVTDVDDNSLVKKILILAANPKSTERLDLDEEIHQIEMVIEHSNKRHQFEIVCVQAVTTNRLRRAMLDHNPQIIHFTGHGAGEQGLVLQNEAGGVQLVNSESLASLFKLFVNQVECVILNANYSEIQATAIAQYINYVVGMSGTISDKSAIAFSEGFYRALGFGYDVESSFQLGCNAIQLENSADFEIPVLKKKTDVLQLASNYTLIEEALATDVASNSPAKKILILTANPKDTSRIDLDEELIQIEESLKRSRKGRQFEAISVRSVTPARFSRAIMEHNPQIIHFSGHGAGEQGLVLQNEAGQSQLVNSESLAGLFKLFVDQVECVVLNASYSEAQATAIAQHINYVIGMSQALGDKAAQKFSVGFYDALAAGCSIEASYALGCNAIALDGIPEHFIPVLKKKSDLINLQLSEELRLALAIVDEQERAEVLAHLMARSPEVPLALLQIVSAIENEEERILALITLIPHLPHELLSNVPAKDIAIFQQQQRIPADGICGPQTLHAIAEVLHSTRTQPTAVNPTLGDITIEGVLKDDSLFTLNQTKIIQVSVDELKSRQFIANSPYKGLRRFESEDADRFFGRDQFLGWVVNELEQTNFILLLGASGSGKSSVVRAGLIPWLQRKWGIHFVSLMFTPDQDPFESFYASLLSRYSQAQAQVARAGKAETLSQVVKTLKQPDTFWLILIDQFEELFTRSESEKRDRFIDSLVELSQTQTPSVKIVATMRSAYLERLSSYPKLLRLTDKHRPIIAEMQADELRLAVEQPAAHHGVVFETGLVEEIIRDVQGQAGYLPLLQYTLDLLWATERESGDLHDRTLNTSTYRQLGGVRGVLQKRVDELYRQLSNAEQLAAMRIFLKLIEIGGDAESATEWNPIWRRASLSEFDDPLEQTVVFLLINENLLIISPETQSQESTVEIAHENLLTSWTTLHQWINEQRQAIALRNRLNGDVEFWLRSNKSDDELWAGEKLAVALELRQDPTFNRILGGFSSTANEFIDASERRQKKKGFRTWFS